MGPAERATNPFELAAERLRPGGLLVSWIQGYALSADALRSVLAAARHAFPRTTLWMAGWGDFVIVAGDESFVMDALDMRERGRRPERDGEGGEPAVAMSEGI